MSSLKSVRQYLDSAKKDKKPEPRTKRRTPGEATKANKLLDKKSIKMSDLLRPKQAKRPVTFDEAARLLPVGARIAYTL